jgi:hypothetical protein
LELIRRGSIAHSIGWQSISSHLLTWAIVSDGVDCMVHCRHYCVELSQTSLSICGLRNARIQNSNPLVEDLYNLQQTCCLYHSSWARMAATIKLLKRLRRHQWWIRFSQAMKHLFHKHDRRHVWEVRSYSKHDWTTYRFHCLWCHEVSLHGKVIRLGDIFSCRL